MIKAVVILTNPKVLLILNITNKIQGDIKNNLINNIIRAVKDILKIGKNGHNNKRKIVIRNLHNNNRIKTLMGINSIKIQTLALNNKEHIIKMDSLMIIIRVGFLRFHWY